MGATKPVNTETTHSADLVINYNTIRHAFIRGEQANIELSVMNNTSEPIEGRLNISITDLMEQTQPINRIEAGRSALSLFRIDTKQLKAGSYTLNCIFEQGEKRIAQTSFKFAVGRQWNPDRMRVWLWPHRKFGINTWKLDDEALRQISWYADKGFNALHPGGGVRASHNNHGGFGPEKFELYDYCLTHGYEISFSPMNAYLLEEQIDLPEALFDPIKEWKPFKKLTNPFHPETAKIQNQLNREIMQKLQHFPQVTLCYLENELELALPAEIPLSQDNQLLTFAAGTPHTFVQPGVIADTDQAYVDHLYRYKWGDGLVISSLRAADIVKQYRSDMLTFSDPLRLTATYNRFKGIDAVSTWTYTTPDPRYILSIETLIANGKPFGQNPIQTISLWNYMGEIAPREKGGTLMGPDRLVETSWLTLSRNPAMMSYYIGSGCDPFDPGYTYLKDYEHIDKSDAYPYSLYPETFEALKRFNEAVIQPYGPMIRKLQRSKRRAAVLYSESSSVYKTSPTLKGHFPAYQLYNFYSILNMAHIPADIVMDETIAQFGLDDYDLLVLPLCETLTETVYNTILEFQKRGGKVIADQYLRAPIPDVKTFNFDLDYRSRVSAVTINEQVTFDKYSPLDLKGNPDAEKVEGVTALEDQIIMESYARQLREGLEGMIERKVDCSTPTVSLNVLENEGVQYIFVINDKREYDDRFGPYKAILGKTVEQTVTLSLDQPDAEDIALYDLLANKTLPYRREGHKILFDVELDQHGGKMIAVHKTPFDHLSIQMQPVIRHRGIPHKITILVQDENAHLLAGAHPLKVTITDPDGNPSEFTDYYAAENGILSIDLIPAVNDRAGLWNIEVKELMTGKTAEASFTLAVLE